jgi:rare lipoprotein A (peptidoglycan hydrolase)
VRASRERIHWTLARVGVGVFAMALLVPAIVRDVPRPATVLVASSSEMGAIERDDAALPKQLATRPRRMTVAPPAAPATEPSANLSAPVVVMASWYGPGFFENRLPCWQWLQASGLPIQLLPDTWGVAHRTLPCGTMLTLTHGAVTITAPVVDRGPYIEGRALDLTPRVKAALGCTDLCTVVMQIR